MYLLIRRNQTVVRLLKKMGKGGLNVILFTKQSLSELEAGEYFHMHRLVLDKIKSRLKKDTDLMLFPFSIKKNANVYGIIFGAKNYAAVDKFLKISWKRNDVNGEADFDIDEDSKKNQIDIFGQIKMTKIEKFKDDLRKMLLSVTPVTNKSVLIYTYENGHIPKHSEEVIKQLKREGKLQYEGKSPYLTYENVFRNKNIIEYKITK